MQISNKTVGNKIGLINIEQCNPCPYGKYCQEGTIQGACAAGFLCYSGADAPNPTYGETEEGKMIEIRPYLDEKRTIQYDINIEISDDGTCPPGNVCAGPCPPGFYCFNNILTELSDIGYCPNGTYREEYGGISPADCDTCPAGYHCSEGIGAKQPCPVGHYCPSWYTTTEPKSISIYWQGPGSITFYVNTLQIPFKFF